MRLPISLCISAEIWKPGRIRRTSWAASQGVFFLVQDFKPAFRKYFPCSIYNVGMGIADGAGSPSCGGGNHGMGIELCFAGFYFNTHLIVLHQPDGTAADVRGQVF